MICTEKIRGLGGGGFEAYPESLQDVIRNGTLLNETLWVVKLIYTS